MSGPNCRPTPRLLGPRPGLGWGSVQSISFTRPSLAGWRLACLSILRISSNVTPSFEKRPPCRTRYLLPTSVASGRALNVSENILNTRSLYLMLVEVGERGCYFARHSPSKPYILFMSSVSWLPRLMWNPSG